MGLGVIHVRGVQITKRPVPVLSIEVNQSFQWAGEAWKEVTDTPFKTSVETENNKLAGNLWSYPVKSQWSRERVINGVAHKSTCGLRKRGLGGWVGAVPG